MRYALNHSELADIWFGQHGQDYKFMPERNEWRKWSDADGWRKVPDQIPRSDMSKVSNACWRRWKSGAGKAKTGEAVKDPRTQGASSTISGGLKEAEPKVLSMHADWDKDKHVMGLPGGMCLDLRSGKVRKQTRGQLISWRGGWNFRSSANPAGVRHWIEDKFPNDADRRWMQKFIGYMLCGDTEEQVALWIHGPTSTGKSTLLRMVAALMGEYAEAYQAEYLVSTKFSMSTERERRLSDMMGKRAALVSEYPDDATFDSAYFCHLTGGDPAQARAIFREHISFTPEFKFLFVSNEIPTEAKGLTPAAARRIAFIEASEGHKEKMDTSIVKDFLERGLPEFAEWAMEGYANYLMEGLQKDKPEQTSEFVEPSRVASLLKMAIEKKHLKPNPDGMIRAGAFADLLHHLCEEDVSLRKLQKDIHHEVSSKTGANNKKFYLGYEPGRNSVSGIDLGQAQGTMLPSSDDFAG